MESNAAAATLDSRTADALEHSGVGAVHGGGTQLREPRRDDVLLAPETDISVDDQSSVYSSVEVADRLTYLEQRVQMQEDEIQLLKLALADVLKRLNVSEEPSAAFTKKGPVQAARPVSLSLASREAVNTTLLLKKGSSSTLPSSMSSRNFSPSPASKKSSPASVRDSPSDSGSRQLSATINTTGTFRKLQESKPKEASAHVLVFCSLGRQKVTHCKVTVQIYLNPLRKRTGSTEAAAATVKQLSVQPPLGKPASKRVETGALSNPAFTFPLQKSLCQSPIYKCPSKSSSQYFQICY